MSDLTIEKVREMMDAKGLDQYDATDYLQEEHGHVIRFLLTEIDRLQVRVEGLEKALRDIGNTAGRPTMQYAPAIESIEQREALGEIAIKVCAALEGKK